MHSCGPPLLRLCSQSLLPRDAGIERFRSTRVRNSIRKERTSKELVLKVRGTPRNVNAKKGVMVPQGTGW